MTATVDPTTPTDLPARRSGRRLLRSLWQDKVALVSTLVLAVFLVTAVFAQQLAPISDTGTDVLNRFRPPAWQDGGDSSFLLGTDGLGRDVFSRIILGTQVTVGIGLAVVVLSGVFGTAIGLVAGLRGGLVGAALMRLVDAQLAFPGLLLILAIITFLGPSVPVIVVVLAIYSWMIYARMVEGLVLQLRSQPFMEAAEMTGCTTWRVVRVHVLPNIASPLLTQTMIEFARVVLAEAALSYLGLGIQPPTASWGLMVAENQSQMSLAWWTVLLPGLALALLVLCINLTANWLRLNTDPRHRQHLAARAFPRRGGR